VSLKVEMVLRFVEQPPSLQHNVLDAGQRTRHQDHKAGGEEQEEQEEEAEQKGET
jgi:hypothetical protein